MKLKSLLSKPLAFFIAAKTKSWSRKPVQVQEETLKYLLKKGSQTEFGKAHSFGQIKNHEDFKRQVPIREYEDFLPFIEKVKNGLTDILWPGKPLYLSKTSGTTAGIKYIPITSDSIPYHISAARDSLLLYINETGKADFVDRKMIFFSGSPELDFSGPIPIGRLSGIVNHYVPKYLRTNQMPSYKTNCIEDWEEKVEAIVDETMKEDMSLISGIPPWVQMYFDKLEQKTGKRAAKLFANFSLFVYGGVNFEPYRKKLEKSIGKKVDTIELYPASEGFIAFQDKQDDKGMLLLLNSGIFYEFIPVNEYGNPNPTRLSIGEVELDVNYALIMSTNAGLWAYSIGDTVKFTSLNPYKIIVTGRVKHFLSAFGEHIIGEEVDNAMNLAATEHHVDVVEFTVAPQVNPKEGLPYHEWFIEFSDLPNDLEAFSMSIDKAMQSKNIYYSDLVKGSVLQPLKITVIKKGGFIEYMKSVGKLGGQNKVPRLANNRTIAEQLLKFSDVR